MVRVRPPRLVNPAHAHETHLASRLDLLSVKQVRRDQAELAADKSRNAKRPALAGAVGDGTALRNLTTLMHEAGLVDDQTVLGFTPGGQTAIIPHKHDLALFRFANSTKAYSPTLVDQDSGQ